MERLALLLLLTTAVGGYRMFADRIPNGQRVPHPCKPNVLWHGVGHFNQNGGGFRNPFGRDFNAAGQKWTTELCHKDSDGDGKTNGEELGDPHCRWAPGSDPAHLTGLSHPGVCEPIDSTACKRKQFDWGLFKYQEEWLDDACQSATFSCPAINDTEVRTMNARIPRTPVPAQETTYTCQIFEFEDLSQDYHMVAATPALDNLNVMHHMVVFGCEDSVAPKSAFHCNMLPDPRCKMILTVWTLGINGDCFHSNAGVRMGKTGIKKFAIQLHWNNPQRISGTYDSSGLQLHYTPILRQFDSSTILLGDEDFTIPPHRDSTVVTGSCPSSCTSNRFTGTVYVTTAFNHMHYLGRQMRVEQRRNGKLVRTITNDVIYDYDSPKMYFFEDPIAVEPGDELKTICNFSSTYVAHTTRYGESTQEEMCYAFLAFYPRQNILGTPFCTSYGSVARCAHEHHPHPHQRGTTPVPEAVKERNCQEHWNQLMQTYHHDIKQMPAYHAVVDNCSPDDVWCTDTCMAAILDAVDADPCLGDQDTWQGIVDGFLSHNHDGKTFLAAMAPCEAKLAELANAKDVIGD